MAAQAAQERPQAPAAPTPTPAPERPQEPPQAAQEPPKPPEAAAQDAEEAAEIARIIAEAEAWDRRMAQEPPPADINEHCDRARESAALHYRADKARRGIIVAPGSIGEQRAVEAAEEQAWETYVPHRSEPEPQAQDNNNLATWKRDLEAAGAPPPRKGRDRDDFSR